MEKKVIIDALKGIAIGDAFGLGLEFKSRFWIAENVKFDQFINLWKGGINNIQPGTYSDDTEHSIGVVEALLSNDYFSEKLLLKKFRAEYENDWKRKGYPRDGHGSIKDWYNDIKTIEEIRTSQMDREDPGNAPVMRSVPLCFVAEEELYNCCKINAQSTHPHLLGIEASYMTALSAWHFLREGGDGIDLIPFLQTNFGNGIREKLSAIDLLPSPDELSEEDYLLLHGVQPLPYIRTPDIYGLPCASMKTALNAVYVLKHSRSAVDALKNSIRMGGDVDSLAAVCTGIAAGRYGLESLPSFLLEKTEGLGRMEVLGGRIYDKYFSKN